MDKTLKGGIIGFLVGGGLTFVLVWGLFGVSDNTDLAGVALSAGGVGGLVGAVIGGVIGAAVDAK
jgi:hypothetical protein